MKERITYLLADGEPGVNPADVLVAEDAIQLPGILAAKEWRITIGVDQLPEEVQAILRDSHELHLRWSSSQYHDSVSPLVSRLPPGLHAFYTPLKGKPIAPGLCPMIKDVFGFDLKCDDTKDAFTRAPVLSERFASSAAYQYYQQIATLEPLQFYLVANLCHDYTEQCTLVMDDLMRASSLDFDFDAISQSVVVTATWPAAIQNGIEQKRSPEDRVEVGILNRETEKDPEKISLGGFLTVLGEDDRPKPTLFSFPSRHHQLPASSPESFTFTTTFREPTGLHPTLQLHFSPSNLTGPLPSCSLHTYLTLPSTLFIDRHQLSDPLFLASQNLAALHSLSGATDLEAPEWVVQQWGSAALFSLVTPDDLPRASQPKAGEPWTVSVPLHLRYLPPRHGKDSATYPSSAIDGDDTTKPGKLTTSVPYPVVFWACPADSGLKMNVNPFDKVNLGYDGLFGPKTLFYHVPPTGATLTVEVEVPVLDLDGAGWVESGTGLVVLVGFAWVLWKLWAGMAGDTKKGSRARQAERAKVKVTGKKRQ
ncbi:PIG-X [Elsinoe ampelina]|uniref:Protein PBN1 n=1 Tax=Elsinoe ampelina TaxID=302913 RepID=A0A6A6GMH3_9PEZI|nr:PIG-X [Elsinoe ampelina]